MPKKNKTQQYFYLRAFAKANLNRLETELDFYLQRENRTVFDNQQELSRWIEQLRIQCETLNSIHRRSTPATMDKYVDNGERLAYRLTANLVVTIYKSKN